MSANSRIEWTDATWNPVTGCTPCSPGCARCYAQRMANRLRGRCGYPADEPFRVTLHPDKLLEPFRWRKPRRVFVCSMGDLFHKDVPDEFIDRALAVVALCPQHTFMVLTKRPERMAAYWADWGVRADGIADAMHEFLPQPCDYSTPPWKACHVFYNRNHPGNPFPLPNLWLGTTCENQAAADERIPWLLKCPAAVRFVSCEPLLEPVDLRHAFTGYAEERPCEHGTAVTRGPTVNWVIAGGETGPGARPAHPDWFRSLRDQCAAAGVPFFFKGWGDWTPQGIEGPCVVTSGNGKRVRVVEHAGRCALMARLGAYRGIEVDESQRRLLDGREHNEFPE